MRLATILDDGRSSVALVREGRCLPVAGTVAASMQAIAGGGQAALDRILDWAGGRLAADWRPLGDVTLGPAVPDPGAIYTVGLNYRAPDEPPGSGPDRPLVYAKAASSVAGHGGILAWDRSLTASVDAECELGVVIGRTASAVSADEAMEHVFGFTIINDVSSRDPWLDGDQWLLGKSMPGFCPVGPWVVSRDELESGSLRLGCTLNGEPLQDGTTDLMRYAIPDVIAYLSRHVVLRPGDLIATGTPQRLTTPPGPDRHLQPGDVVTAWIEGIGELTTTIA
jgi:2-keto-4-pentenoate hydratase/2-oxohepta-3-ene-1,7-dioic acid hydratase in catechol pathway